MAGDGPDTPRKTRMLLSAQFASSRCLPLNSGMRGTLKNRGPWISLVLILLLAGMELLALTGDEGTIDYRSGPSAPTVTACLFLFVAMVTSCQRSGETGHCMRPQSPPWRANQVLARWQIMMPERSCQYSVVVRECTRVLVYRYRHDGRLRNKGCAEYINIRRE